MFFLCFEIFRVAVSPFNFGSGFRVWASGVFRAASLDASLQSDRLAIEDLEVQGVKL